MSEIINITCAERKLMAQVQALTEQLELECNTVLAMSEQLESVRADAARLQIIYKAILREPKNITRKMIDDMGVIIGAMKSGGAA